MRGVRSSREGMNIAEAECVGVHEDGMRTIDMRDGDGPLAKCRSCYKIYC